MIVPRIDRLVIEKPKVRRRPITKNVREGPLVMSKHKPEKYLLLLGNLVDVAQHKGLS